MHAQPPDSIQPLFLGPNAENQQLFEKILLEFLRDHAYWRRNFHPEDGSVVPTSAQYQDVYLDMVAKIRRELGALSADLKRAAPFYSPRYLGHMNSDLLIPGLIAQIMTMLYNPNNVSEEAGPATVSRELEVGRQLAKMLGYNTDPNVSPCAWGHLTSGGTVANYEALYNFREVKFFPLAAASAIRRLGLELDVSVGSRFLLDLEHWDLVNIPIRDTVCLAQNLYRALHTIGLSEKEMHDFWTEVNSESMKHLGAVAFFERYPNLNSPVILAPATAHYSWEKALRLLGMGERQLWKIQTTDEMVIDLDHFRDLLWNANKKRQPVLAVIAVFGTTEFSSVDPIAEIMEYRDQMRRDGLDFSVHVDAAWGGYLASLFRRPDGMFCAFEEVQADFKHFPSKSTYAAVQALAKVDSATIDPHKLGYLPYPNGAYVCRDDGVIDFITQKVSYLYDLKTASQAKNQESRLRNLGQFILEGSKPGAAAAAAYVCHRVLPLHKHGFGSLVARTIRACEYFRKRLMVLAKVLEDKVRIVVPVEPQTNILCFAFNPVRNSDLGLMNHFERQIFEKIKIDYQQPLQIKDFIGSYTSLVKAKVPEVLAQKVLEALGIQPASFTMHPTNPRESDHIFLFRHSLMSPWLLEKSGKESYLDRYCHYLEGLIKNEMDREMLDLST